MRTVLILSRFLPPAYDVGGKRAHRFARYLPEHGWRPVILTGRAPRSRPADPTPAELPAAVRVARDMEPRWWRERRGHLSDGTVPSPVEDRYRPASGARLLGRRLRGVLRVPVGVDAFLTPRVAARARRLAEREGAEVLFATGGPPSTLLFGVAARAATGLPLCLDFRDPWSLNFLQDRRARWVRGVERAVEARLLERADRVTFASRAAAAAYAGAYPRLADKFTAILTGFDPAYRPAPARPAGPVTLVHFGNCYGPRSLATVLRAVASLRDAGRTGPRGVRVLNLGRASASDVALAAELGIRDRFEYRPMLPYAEGLEVLAAADVSLLPSYGEETLFIPAKLFDCMLTGTPVLCLARRSELTSLVEESGAGRWVEPGDVDGAARVIERAIAARDVAPSPAPSGGRDPDRFSARRAAARLAGLLDELAGGPP